MGEESTFAASGGGGGEGGEADPEEIGASPVWVIDPLDGTTNFVSLLTADCCGEGLKLLFWSIFVCGYGTFAIWNTHRTLCFMLTTNKISLHPPSPSWQVHGYPFFCVSIALAVDG